MSASQHLHIIVAPKQTILIMPISSIHTYSILYFFLEKRCVFIKNEEKQGTKFFSLTQGKRNLDSGPDSVRADSELIWPSQTESQFTV